VPDADYVLDAVSIAKAINGAAPVSLQWSREDDTKAGRYRPMAYHQFKAAIDSDNNIAGWHQRVVSQSILRGTPFEALITGGLDTVLSEGGATLPYNIPNFTFDGHEAESGVPVLWWRSVGHTHNAYATEVFFDEVAHKMKQDPAKLRQELLAGHPRHLAVLNKVIEASNWGAAQPDGVALGVAVHESFSSFVAEVAQVRLNPNKSFVVEKVWCAVDCGIAITPDVIKAQMEGGIGYGLSAILGETITFDEGKVQQNNFYDYTPLRINQMPDIEVFIVQSGEAPTGVGEPGVPPIGPAVANALRVLTGKPITKLPMGTSVA
jgi:isoquinoline 1-oxidoreductase beta subunit